jgi:hypothetical protein
MSKEIHIAILTQLATLHTPNFKLPITGFEHRPLNSKPVALTTAQPQFQQLKHLHQATQRPKNLNSQIRRMFTYTLRSTRHR